MDTGEFEREQQVREKDLARALDLRAGVCRVSEVLCVLLHEVLCVLLHCIVCIFSHPTHLERALDLRAGVYRVSEV